MKFMVWVTLSPKDTQLNVFNEEYLWLFMKCFENTGNFVKVNELETRVKCFRLLKGKNKLGLKT